MIKVNLLAPISNLTCVAIVDVTSLVTFASADLKGEKALIAYQLCANDSSMIPLDPFCQVEKKKKRKELGKLSHVRKPSMVAVLIHERKKTQFGMSGGTRECFNCP
jgi:hypothetical protein